MKQIGVASLVIVISLALAVLCAGCAAPTTPSPSPSAASTTSATALGAAITVTQGQNFTIQLQSNASSGYRWEPTYDNSSIMFINRAYVASSMPTPGAPGADVFTFQGIKEGTSVITFNNVTPSNQIANSVNYTVTCTATKVTQGNAALVAQGQNFTIQLQSNPSTGYRWQPTYDNSTVTLVNQAFASGVSNATTAIVGVGGTDLFTFQGIKGGTSVITFNNVSPANETMNSASYTVVITS